MGGSGSKQAQLDKFGQLLSVQEKEALSSCFAAVAGSPDAESFSEDKLQAYLSGPKMQLPPEIISRLFGILRGEDRDVQVTFASFILNGSQLLKSSISQKSQCIHRLCDSRAPTLAGLQSLLQTFLQAVLRSPCYEAVFPHARNWTPAGDNLSVLVSNLTDTLRQKLSRSSSEEDVAENQPVSVSDLESWLISCSLALRVFEIGFAFCFYQQAIRPDATPSDIRSYLGLDSLDARDSLASTERLLIPIKMQHPIFRETFSSKLLDQSSLMLLNSYFPHEFRGKLYPLFSSLHHGESFSTFCKQLMDKGPTLVVVRDTGGNVFGGFAAESWHYNPQFTGNASCFLFTLLPKMGVFQPTGYNENYMYLQQTAQTLPNGLGMGGQLEYFGLWLSADYGKGHSKAKPQCTTYGSPMLSATEEFQVDLLEVWGVGSPQVPEGEAEGGSGRPSILDKDKAATAILEMAGKTIHSKGLREPEEDT